MLTDEQFINGVWDKYNDYIYSNNKEIYFKKHHYKNTDLIIKLTTLITYATSIFATAGIVYAGIVTYNFIQKHTTTNFNNNQGYEYNQDMIQVNGIYYKKIMTYEEYIESKNKWSDLVEMKKEDFENYFVMVLAGENYNTTGLYISNVETDDNMIYIDLNKKDTYDESTIISVKLEKCLNRDYVEIRNNSNIPDMSNNYVEIENLDNEYTEEQAIKDDCFVIKYNKLVSDNNNQFDEFIDNCNNGIEGTIRIYNYELTEKIIVTDIEYKNGKINMSSYDITAENSETINNSGKKILKAIIGDEKNKKIFYSLEDEIGNKKIICAIDL